MIKLDEYPQEGDEMTAINTTGYVANEMYDRMNYGGGYNQGAGYSNLTSLQHGQECNRQLQENADDNHTDALRAGLGNITANFENATRSREFTAVNKNITDSEFRSLDRQRDIDKTLAAMAAANALCCCDTQKAIADAAKEAAKCCAEAQLAACKSHAELMSEIKASESRNIERSLNAANAELTALKTQIACGCCPPRA